MFIFYYVFGMWHTTLDSTKLFNNNLEDCSYRKKYKPKKQMIKLEIKGEKNYNLVKFSNFFCIKPFFVQRQYDAVKKRG